MRLTWKQFLAAVGLGAALTFTGIYAVHTMAADTKSELSPETQQAIAYAKDLSRAFRETAGRVLPSVVTIRGEFGLESPSSADGSVDGSDSQVPNRRQPSIEEMIPPEFRPFFRNPGMGDFGNQIPNMPRGGRQGYSVGSGVVIDESGIILTNNHVVSDADKLIVTFDDGTEYTATDIKCDPQTDLAIVRIEGAKDLVAAPLGDSDQVEVGDWVLALGNPFGRLSGSVTAGIVSAKDRSIGVADRESFIQTDAAINPGNSGGPLVNLAGEVIGINTAISSTTGNFAGVGLAIPSNSAKWVVEQLKSTGSVKRAYLGVEIRQLPSAIASEHGLKPHDGVLVGRISADSPAAKAGVEPDDIILSFDGKKIDSPDQLQAIVERAEAGKSYPMEVLRDQDRLTLNVEPLERPESFTRHPENLSNSPKSEGADFGDLGISVQTLTPELAKQLGADVEAGVVVSAVQPGSTAELAGIQTGSIILEANRQPVKTAEEFSEIVKKSEKKKVMLKIWSEEGTWLQTIDWNNN
ncbi:MAG: Do family serine endopeptidase [Thermoguttaceae bacterium]|nr:Do family serine endopeptidase [Thermoguttaceae bacterium]